MVSLLYFGSYFDSGGCGPLLASINIMIVYSLCLAYRLKLALASLVQASHSEE